jgi:DNA-binding transcriptional LysR family regulator
MQSLRHLELVRALAAHRNFGRAAEALGISQPALTRGLQHLEETLGVRLFDREDGPVRPTAFGEIIIERGEPIITAFAEMRREIDRARGVDSGSIKVAAGPFPAEICAQRAIARLSREHPMLRCELLIKDWVEVIGDVMSGRADIGIADITEARDHADLDVEPIRSDRLELFCRAHHPLLQKNRIALEDVLAYPWAGPHIPRHMRAHIGEEPRVFAVADPETGRVRPRIRVETVGAILEIVAHSDAISAAPFVVLAGRDGLSTLPVEPGWLAVHYGFIRRRGVTPPPAVSAFMDAVRAVEGELAGQGFVPALPLLKASR